MNKYVFVIFIFLATSKIALADILIGGAFNSYYRLVDVNIYSFYYNNKNDDRLVNDTKAAYQFSNGYLPSFKIGYKSNLSRVYFEYQRLKKSGIFSKGFDTDINISEDSQISDVESQIISDFNDSQLDLDIFKLSNDWMFNINKSFAWYSGVSLALAKVNKSTDSLNSKPKYKNLNIEYNSFMFGGGLQTGFVYNFYKYFQLDLGLSGLIIAGSGFEKLHSSSDISSKGVLTKTRKVIGIPNVYLGLNLIF